METLSFGGIDTGDIDNDGILDVVAAENIQGNLYSFTVSNPTLPELGNKLYLPTIINSP